MSSESINPPVSLRETQKKTTCAPDIWDNTPEEEDREIDAFMEWAWMALEETLPPYDWGDRTPSDK